MLGTLAFFADAPLLLLATKPLLLLASLVTATVVVVATFLAAAVLIATRGLLCRDDAWVVCLVPALIALPGFTSTFSPATTESPALRRCGAMM